MPLKRILILSVLLALLVTGCSGSGTSPTPTPTATGPLVFDTPEDTIHHYFEGLAQNDLHKILEASAIAEMSEKFKFDRYTDRIGYILPIQTEFPAEYPFYVELNRSQIASQILGRVRIFAHSLLSQQDVSSGQPVKMDAASIGQFVKDVDPKRLSGLKVEKIAPSNILLMKEARYRENADKLAQIYGADESTERVALFSFDQKEYYLGFTLLRYGDTWKISAQTSPIANINAMGVPEKITAQEFENMVGR